MVDPPVTGVPVGLELLQESLQIIAGHSGEKTVSGRRLIWRIIAEGPVIAGIDRRPRLPEGWEHRFGVYFYVKYTIF